MTSSNVVVPAQRAAARNPADPEIALEVTNLGKRYRIGESAHVHTLFAERLNHGLKSALRRPSTRKTQEDREIWALRNVSFDVRFGEVVGIIGANGAGKSTLLKVMSRISAPTEGRVVAHGRLATLLEVGTGFHPELTGRENVFLNGSLLGMRRREIAAKFDEIVQFSGVQRFLETPVKRYSSGMYVRLAFAVAAHLDPEVLLVDEVLSVGDAEFQRRCFEKMRDVTGEGRAVVFVSHGMTTVQQICQRVMLLEHGQVQMVDEPEAVVAAYLDEVQPTHVTMTAEGSIAVPDDYPREGSGEIELRNVRLHVHAVDRQAGTAQLRFGEPLRIDLEFDVREEIDDAVFEVGISTVDRVRLVTVHSTDQGLPPTVVLPGTHRMRVEIPVTLIPGEYALDVGVHRATSGFTADSVNRIARIHALNGPEGGDRYPWQVIRGYVRPGADFGGGDEV
jgi:lipopolysaccharide transport system ATP-binding protein